MRATRVGVLGLLGLHLLAMLIAMWIIDIPHDLTALFGLWVLAAKIRQGATVTLFTNIDSTDWFSSTRSVFFCAAVFHNFTCWAIETVLLGIVNEGRSIELFARRIHWKT